LKGLDILMKNYTKRELAVMLLREEMKNRGEEE